MSFSRPLSMTRMALRVSARPTPFRPAGGAVRFYGRGNLPINWGLVVVPQQSAWVVERFGKFSTILEPGLHVLVPVMDRIAYVHSLKELALAIPNQTAITRDNVTIQIDGVLYVKVINPELASYGVEDPLYAVTQLAQTTMRSELGKITLDKTFEERENLNQNIVAAINHASENAWGVKCLRYEIRDIMPPVSVKAAMDLQAEAERRKRAEILESEGLRDAAINTAEGKKQSIVLQARGEAEAIVARAQASAEGLLKTAAAISSTGGHNAVSMRIAEQYIAAFANLAQKGNTILLPSNAGDVSSMVAQAMTVYERVRVSSKLGEGAAIEDAAAAAAAGGAGAADDAKDNTSGPFVPKPWDKA